MSFVTLEIQVQYKDPDRLKVKKMKNCSMQTLISETSSSCINNKQKWLLRKWEDIIIEDVPISQKFNRTKE